MTLLRSIFLTTTPSRSSPTSRVLPLIRTEGSLMRKKIPWTLIGGNGLAPPEVVEAEAVGRENGKLEEAGGLVAGLDADAAGGGDEGAV